MAKYNDEELYEKWVRSKSNADLQALLKNLEPLIYQQVSRQSGTLSSQLLAIQAKKLAIDAIKSFNPYAGAKLSTHVTNQLQKLSRVNYAHQNAARIPEHSMIQFHTVNIISEDIKAETGREATQEELADRLGWSPKKLEQFQTSFSRPELLEHTPTPGDMFVHSQHDPRVDYVYMSLTPRQQAIFELTTGYQGKKRLSNPEIMKKLGITQGVLSYEKTKITQALRRVLD